MIIDRLVERVKKVGACCVGLDTSFSYLPESFCQGVGDRGEAMYRFNREIIDATHDITAIYKLQIAYYEAEGLAGLRAYQKTLAYLREKKALTIGDVKRGDIAATAKEYARAHFSGDFEVDFITLNPYMGLDSIEPYMEYMEQGEKGVFVLLRTSNPGAKDIQYLENHGKRVYDHMGDALQEMTQRVMGNSGYSNLGFVVGGTHQDEVEEIRLRYANNFFLIPGYGAQKAEVTAIRRYLPEQNGGVVNSSRGILKAYVNHADGERHFQDYARQAVLAMREDIHGLQW